MVEVGSLPTGLSPKPCRDVTGMSGRLAHGREDVLDYRAVGNDGEALEKPLSAGASVLGGEGGVTMTAAGL